MKKVHKKWKKKYYPFFYTRKIIKSKRIFGKKLRKYKRKIISITIIYKTIKR